MLVEAGDRLLSGFSPELSAYARRRLEQLGVEVLLGQAVEAVDPRHVSISGSVVPVGLTVWAAGVSASPLASQLGVELDRGGRVSVGADLRVIDCPDVFALGDIARFANRDERPLPGLAQVAKQQGRHLGNALARHITSGQKIPAFVYRSRGNTAIVGRHAAVFESGRMKLKGWPAWIAWAVIHVYLLVGFQHRIQVSIQWLWRYLTYERGARLIAHPESTTLPQRDRQTHTD